MVRSTTKNYLNLNKMYNKTCTDGYVTSLNASSKICVGN